MIFSPTAPFFTQEHVGLKICGICTENDAQGLVDIGIAALGINFWESSKRYCPPNQARKWLTPLAEKIIRVGVFVNAPPSLPQELWENNIIDIIQLHGDESPEYCHHFIRLGIPFIKAFGVNDAMALRRITQYHTNAVLLDAPAPQTYGGTGTVFDWNLAELFVRRHKATATILAGGITVDNALEAATLVRPAWLDVASGSELQPKVKDLDACATLQNIVSTISRTHPPDTTLLSPPLCS